VGYASFVPELWSRVILAAEQKNLVFGSDRVANSDYEGEISGPGDSVHINQLSDPTISDYEIDQDLVYETLESGDQMLLIDQKKYFSFRIDDVDKRQAAGELQPYLEGRASYKLADTADQFLAGFYTGVAPANVLIGDDATNSSLTTANGIVVATYDDSTPADLYLKVVLPLKVKLDEALVPKQGRYIIFPPWAETLLAETKAFTAVTDMSGQPSQAFQNGVVGTLTGGFTVMSSNNAVEYDASNGGWVVQAGHSMALTFAEQIVQTEALRLQTSFSDAVRGLHVYGGKLVRPDHIAVAGVVRPAGI